MFSPLFAQYACNGYSMIKILELIVLKKIRKHQIIVMFTGSSNFQQMLKNILSKSDKKYQTFFAYS